MPIIWPVASIYRCVVRDQMSDRARPKIELTTKSKISGVADFLGHAFRYPSAGFYRAGFRDFVSRQLGPDDCRPAASADFADRVACLGFDLPYP